MYSSGKGSQSLVFSRLQYTWAMPQVAFLPSAEPLQTASKSVPI
jgi:hypothetical protein